MIGRSGLTDGGKRRAPDALEGAVVLDPYMGSGTTGVAAKRLGRRHIGVDIGPRYCGGARRRMAAATRQ